ncbi:MAG TPA: DUF4296 domain-containing protein [Ignavibacteriaceae bacterium]
MNSDQKSQPEADQPIFENVRSRNRYWLIICLIFFIASCEENPPVSDKKFLELYVDLLIIQDTTTTNFYLDSVKTLVLDRYNVSIEQYDAMIKYYNSSPEKWIAFYDSATAYVERLSLADENQP